MKFATQQYTIALKYDNNDTAKLIIHTLKGVSGNICAELLHNIVIELDEEINKKDFNAQNVNSLITNASREIKDILSSFHDSKIFYNTQQKKILLKSCSASELIEKLKVLQPYLANYDTGAQIIVDKAIQAFSASGYEEEIIAIKQYVIEFEYEAAFKLVAKLFRRLEHKDGNK